MNRAAPRALLSATIVAFLLPAAPARAAVFDVSNFEDLAPNGCTPGDCTLREAIIDANASAGADTILLDGGTYELTRTGAAEDAAASGDLDVRRDGLEIIGRGPGVTIIDAGEQAGINERVFDVEYGGTGGQPAVTMSNLTITGGWANSGSEINGGGIWLQDGTLSLADVGLIDNYGGENGSGGGLQAENGTTATLRRVDVADNATTIAGSAAGILVNFGATVTIDDSAVVDNASMYVGGGIAQYGGTLTVRNTTISGNSTPEGGGGMYASGGTTTLSNVTMTRNVADVDQNGSGQGGGIQHQGGTLTIRNSIVAQNDDRSPGTQAEDCTGTVTSQGHNILGNGEGCTFASATGDRVGSQGSPIDPKLGPLADNGGPTPTHALLRGSPAIDAGNPAAPGSGGSACEATDQRGISRNCDIGAYELVLCAKVPVNRIGTERKDKLRGTNGPDGMLGLGGNDTLKGKGGRDGLCGGGGKDTMSGGGGKDTMKGQGGKDTCTGGGGRDRATCEKEKTVP